MILKFPCWPKTDNQVSGKNILHENIINEMLFCQFYNTIQKIPKNSTKHPKELEILVTIYLLCIVVAIRFEIEGNDLSQ